MIDLLQMRENHLLQDRIELLGPVRHSDVRSVRTFQGYRRRLLNSFRFSYKGPFS